MNPIRLNANLFVLAIAVVVTTVGYRYWPEKLAGPSAAQMAIVSHTDYTKPIPSVGPVRLSAEAQSSFNDSAAVLRGGKQHVQPEGGDTPRLSIADLHGGR